MYIKPIVILNMLSYRSALHHYVATVLYYRAKFHNILDKIIIQ